MPGTLNSLQNKRVGLALSGGAVRGLAHIGVIKALQEACIRPVVVVGTSVGSIVGAALAAGMDWRDMADMARSVFWPRLLHGNTLERFSAQYLPRTFAQLETPFAVVATIIPSFRPLTITSGSLASAISASCAVRLLRRAVFRDGLLLKDGGFSCVLPTQACRDLGADFVIASDVWEWSSLLRSLGSSPSRMARAYPAHYRFALSHTDIHIHPEIPVRGYVPGRTAVDRLIAIGERSTYIALESAFKKRAALSATDLRFKG
jgi:NTE family protein